jgi:hypothetical protein
MTNGTSSAAKNVGIGMTPDQLAFFIKYYNDEEFRKKVDADKSINWKIEGQIYGFKQQGLDNINALIAEYNKAIPHWRSDKKASLLEADHKIPLSEESKKAFTQGSFEGRVTFEGVTFYVTMAGGEIVSAIKVSNTAEKSIQETPKTWTSTDKYVGETANAIEAKYPGKVVDVNKKVYRADGTPLTDYDIELNNAIIQVKQGGGKGATKQAINTASSTSKEVIVYLPDQNTCVAVVKGLQKEGFKVFTN